jgi:hypothetical protein
LVTLQVTITLPPHYRRPQRFLQPAWDLNLRVIRHLMTCPIKWTD